MGSIEHSLWSDPVARFHRARPRLAGALNAQGKNGGKWRFFRRLKPPFSCLEPEFIEVSH
jgi:hypothetical protein